MARAPRKTDTTAEEAPVENAYVDLTDAELEAAIDGYAMIPASVKAEMASGRRTRWEQEARIQRIADAEAAAAEAAAAAAEVVADEPAPAPVEPVPETLTPAA